MKQVIINTFEDELCEARLEIEALKLKLEAKENEVKKENELLKEVITKFAKLTSPTGRGYLQRYEASSNKKVLSEIAEVIVANPAILSPLLCEECTTNYGDVKDLLSLYVERATKG